MNNPKPSLSPQRVLFPSHQAHISATDQKPLCIEEVMTQWRARDMKGSQAAKRTNERMNKARMNSRKWRIIRSSEEKAGYCICFFFFCPTLMWIWLQFVMKWLFRSQAGSLSNSLHTSEHTMLYEWSCEWGKSKSISFGWICKRLTLSSYQEL